MTRRMLALSVVALWAIVASGQSRPFFGNGQRADLLLSGYGFNRTGGALRFNHPGGVAVVSGSLVLADRNNNRVLVWQGLPSSGTEPPAFVLGQPSFDTNDPGTGLDAFNWPTAVATDGRRLYVADTYNDRILVWRSLPTRTRQPADFAITRTSGVSWPWGIWTDGRRLAVSATQGGRVLIWNRVPDSDQSPDLSLRSADFGTPRTVESDGTRLLVSDHNARNASSQPGNFFWRQFPTSETQAQDFFMAAVPGSTTPVGAQVAQGEHMHDAEALSDGRLVALFNRTLCIWRTFPTNATDACGVSVGAQRGLTIDAGDNSGVAVSNGRLFVSLNNGNKVLAWNRVPESDTEAPAFVMGSPDATTNTLLTDGIITNAVMQTDGRRLWASSDFDRKLHVWPELPTTDGQKPSTTYDLSFAPWASARMEEGLVLAGQSTVMAWRSPPLGQPADVVLERTIGSVGLDDLRGVAYDGTYFYLSSQPRGRIYVWRGLPTSTTSPVAEIAIDQPGRMSSDGRYLAVAYAGIGGGVRLYDVATITSSTPRSSQVGQGLGINLPQGVTLASGGLFIADTNSNRVLAWRSVDDAYQGRQPDAVLGADDLRARTPAIGQATLFWPGTVAFDGTRLWVGEFKFSNRIVRYSAR